MFIYEQDQSNVMSALLEHSIHIHVAQHIIEIMKASPEAHFFYYIEAQSVSASIFLVEHNPTEGYNVAHFFSCDQIGDDYLYQSLPVEQIGSLVRFISCLPIS